MLNNVLQLKYFGLAIINFTHPAQVLNLRNCSFGKFITQEDDKNGLLNSFILLHYIQIERLYFLQTFLFN